MERQDYSSGPGNMSVHISSCQVTGTQCHIHVILKGQGPCHFFVDLSDFLIKEISIESFGL